MVSEFDCMCCLQVWTTMAWYMRCLPLRMKTPSHKCVSSSHRVYLHLLRTRLPRPLCRVPIMVNQALSNNTPCQQHSKPHIQVTFYHICSYIPIFKDEEIVDLLLFSLISPSVHFLASAYANWHIWITSPPFVCRWLTSSQEHLLLWHTQLLVHLG